MRAPSTVKRSRPVAALSKRMALRRWAPVLAIAAVAMFGLPLLDTLDTEAKDLTFWNIRSALKFGLLSICSMAALVYLLLEDRVRLKKALKDTPEGIDPLLASMGEAMYGVNNEGNCTFCNPACAEILGHPDTDHILGRNMHDLMHHSYADGAPYPVEECTIYDAHITGTPAHKDNEIFWRADGTSFPAEYRSHPIIRNGAIEGSVVTFSDITARKQTETELHKSAETQRGMFDESVAAIFVFDQNKNITNINQSTLKLLGYTKEEMIGMNVETIDANPSDVIQQQRRVLSGTNITSFEHQVRRKDGKILTVLNNARPLTDGEGQIIGMQATLIDISDRKRAEEETQLALQEAKVASVAKSEFLTSMSPELRTPLNAILGFAQILQSDTRTPLTSAQAEYVGHIFTGGQHLLELVNQVLDLAKIEADQLALAIGNVDACQSVVECIAQMSPLGVSRKIVIDNDLKPTPEIMLRTDGLRLKQILMNLLSNAIKYNKDGGVVTVTGRPVDNNFFRISVTDTGIGIAERDKESLFQVFHRIGESEQVAKEGTGLGLSVTKLLVERMAGQIGVDSMENVGSTFWFDLPLATNEDILIWDDNFRVGVDALDKDHQEIVALVNKFLWLPEFDDALTDTLDKLTTYTNFHLRREEEIMRICDFPDFSRHRLEHRQFIELTKEFSKKWEHQRSTESLKQLRTFLSQSWTDHILISDADISRHSAGKEDAIHDAIEKLQQTHGLSPRTHAL